MLHACQSRWQRKADTFHTVIQRDMSDTLETMFLPVVFEDFGLPYCMIIEIMGLRSDANTSPALEGMDNILCIDRNGKSLPYTPAIRRQSFV